MRRLSTFGLGVALIWAAMTAAPVGQGRSVVVKGSMSGDQENPPTSTGTVGNVACTVTDTQVDCRVDFFNAQASVTGGHIHIAPRSANGPIVCDAMALGVSNDFGFNFTCTASNFTPRNVVGMNSFEDFVQTLSSGGAYFNLHTQLFPAGDARAQLCPPSAEANPFTGVAICTSK